MPVDRRADKGKPVKPWIEKLEPGPRGIADKGIST